MARHPAPRASRHGYRRGVPATTDIAAYLAPLVVRADGDHKQLVVYVGASWCKPCRHFHDAAAGHQLDD